jgi:ABC-type polysaccharide/polyol phosphate export permease
VLYDLRFPARSDVLYFSAWAVALLGVGVVVFRRLDRRLAEEV